MRDYLRLLRFVLPYKVRFAFAGISMVFSAIFDGVSLAMIVPLADKVLTNKKIILPTKLPPFLANLVSGINNTPATVLLNYMSVAIIILFFVKGLFNFLQGYLMSDIGQRVVMDIRSKLYTKLQDLSLDYYTHKRSGELMSRITNDVKVVENAVSYGSTDLIYQGAQVVIFLFLTLFLYPKMAAVVLLLVPVISFPIIRVGKKMRKLSKSSQEKMADINSFLYETILGARIVKAFGMEQHEINKFNRANYDYYRLTMKSLKRLLILNPTTEIIGAIAGIFVFFWGGREVIAGTLSFGIFGLFLGSLLSLIRPFKKLSQVHSLNQQAVAASVRIYEVLDTKPSIQDKPNAMALTGFHTSIVFEDVWFKYADNEVLKEINLEVKKGQIVAIVGPSGTGKTTLVDLVARFYDPYKGRILVSGIDIRDVTLSSLRQQIGIVSQETILFNDTIRGNIAYGRQNATMGEIESAAKKAHAHEFIQHMPLGYDTLIGDRGMKLSGGERQRIAIARALLKDPPILILDEATSQLDSHSEHIVQEALETLMSGRTVLMIAHRLSTVRAAHKIVALDRGQIVEEGPHNELLAKDGLYRRLYHMQELQK